MNATLEKSGSDYLYKLLDGTTYKYGSDGKLVSIETRAGYETTFTYSSGKLSTVTDQDSGRSLAVTWNGAGTRIATITDGASRTVTYAYDGSGDLTDATDAGGAHWKFGYDGSHQLTSVRHPNQTAAAVTNQDVVNTYTAGKVTTQTDNRVSPALVRTFDYTTIPGATRITDPEGNVRVDYYTDGRRTKVVEGYGTAAAVTRTFGYDLATGAVTSVTVGEGVGAVTVATNTYDSSGNLLSSTDALGRTTKATYNGFAQPLTVTDPSGVVSTFTYDSIGNVTSECSPLGTVPGGGTLRCSDVAAGNQAKTTWTYGDSSHPADVTMVKSSMQQDSNVANSTRFSYEVDGQVDWSLDAVGNKTSYDYDGVGRLTSSISPRGNASGATPANFTTTFTVDGYGAATGIAAPSTTSISRTFDADHNLLTETGPDGNTTTYVYDGVGRLTESRVASNTGSPSVSKQRWWADGSLKESEDPAGNITAYGYDEAGRLVSETDPSGTRAYGYDAFSRVVAKQDPGGNCAGSPATGCTTFGYDNASQLQTVTYSDGVTPNITASVYDANGRLTSRTSPAGTTTQGWDTLGRMTSSAVGATTTGYGYDLAGRTTSITYPGFGTPVTRAYDAAGRWTSVNDGAASGGNTTTFGYDEDTNLRTVTFPGSVNVDTYGVDNAGRPTAVTFKKSSTTLGSFAYTRDGAGRVTGEDVSVLTAADSTYGYNALGQMSSHNSNAFTYDAAGNLTSQPGQVQQYNAANQVCWTATSGSGACNAAPTGAATYGFDARGNRTSVARPDAPNSNFTYDQANRMTSAEVPIVNGNQGQYHEVDPVQIMNTQSGSQAGTCNPSPCQRFTNDSTVLVKVAGVGGVPATGVEAVTLSVSSYGSSSGGSLVVWRSDGTRPGSRNVYFTNGESVSNRVVTKLGADGWIAVAAPSGATEVSISVEGWYSSPTGTAGGTFHALDLTKVMDTRTASQTGLCPTTTPQCTPLVANTVKTVQIAGQGGVPATGVSAVAVNITALAPPSAGSLKAYRNGTQPNPYTSMYYTPSENSVVSADLKIANGRLDLIATTNLEVTIDVVGYWTSPSAQEGGQYIPLDPARAMSTTAGTGTCVPSPCAPIPTNTTITVQFAGKAGLPLEGIGAVTINVTAQAPTDDGSLLVWPADQSTPSGVRNHRFESGENAVVALTTALSPDGAVKIRNVSSGTTGIFVDVQGYYSETGTSTWTYGYDNDGIRTSKTSPTGATTTYTWDKTNPVIPLLLTETTGSDTTRYIYGPGGVPLEQINPDGSVTYLHQDQLGSIRMLTNSSGNNVGERAYTPYGKTSVSTGSVATPFGYAGQYTDAESGLQYLRARYYDPQSSQFLSRDPLQGISREAYGYGGTDPLRNSDPSGLLMRGSCKFGELSAVLGGTGAGVSGVTCTAEDSYGEATVTSVASVSGAANVGVGTQTGGFYSNADGVWQLANLGSCSQVSISFGFIGFSGSRCSGPDGLWAVFVGGGVGISLPFGLSELNGTTTVDYGDGGICAPRERIKKRPDVKVKVDPPYRPGPEMGYTR